MFGAISGAVSKALAASVSGPPINRNNGLSGVHVLASSMISRAPSESTGDEDDSIGLSAPATIGNCSYYSANFNFCAENLMSQGDKTIRVAAEIIVNYYFGAIIILTDGRACDNNAE